MDHTIKDGEDLVRSFQPLLELYVFVPEGMRQEVEADALRASFEQSMMLPCKSRPFSLGKGGVREDMKRGQQT